MRTGISPELKFDQPGIVRLSIPKPSEVSTPIDLKFTLPRNPAYSILNLSQLASEIQKPPLTIFRRDRRDNSSSNTPASSSGEDNLGYVGVRDRRCDRCGLRHPSSVECGHNMVVAPKSFRVKRMFLRRRLNSSGLY